jgi:hypothetical protein
MANGYSATGYGLAIRDEKDKSSMGYEIGALRICKWGVLVCLEIISSMYLCCEKRYGHHFSGKVAYLVLDL